MSTLMMIIGSIIALALGYYGTQQIRTMVAGSDPEEANTYLAYHNRNILEQDTTKDSPCFNQLIIASKNRKYLVETIIYDVELFHAYHNSYDTAIFNIWTAAYIVENKLTRSKAYPLITMFRQFNFVNRTRTCDQAKAILTLVDKDTADLLTMMIERELSQYTQYAPDVYETMMTNCIFDLIQHTLEQIDNDNTDTRQSVSESSSHYR